MAFKPAARKGLLVIGVLYAITAAVMVVRFREAAKPAQPEQAARRVQEKLNEVRRDLRGETAEEGAPAPSTPAEDALEDDPEHIRTTPISEKEAARIFQDYFRARGKIVGVNFTLVMQCLNFGILLLVLYGLAWDPMLRFLDERRRIIQGRLADAAKLKEESEGVLKTHHDELSELRRERADILEQARSMGEQEGSQLLERARREAQRVQRDGRERLGEQVRTARAALRRELAELATKIAAHILAREVTQEEHDKAIKEALQRIESEVEDSGEAADEGQ